MKTWQDFDITPPTRYGSDGEGVTTCPQCSPHRKKRHVKCLSVNVQKEVWVCHHCDWRGTLKAGVTDNAKPLQHRPKEWRKPNWQPAANLEQWALDWFAKRGIGRMVLERNGVKSASVYMPQLEDYANVVQFPFKRGHEVVNVKHRTVEGKYFRMESGAERIFYGLNDMEEAVVVVEGELDKLSMEEAGIRNCVSVPDGAPAPSSKDYASKFDFLHGCQDAIDRVSHWILAVDNDEPGMKLEEELVRRFGIEKCRRVAWPEGCKDANDVLLKHGKQVLNQCIADAKAYPVVGAVQPGDMVDRLKALYVNGMRPGVSPGWDWVAELYTVRPGEWTVVTGIPGHGKSEFIDAILVNIAKEHGWRFALYSPENHPTEQHMAKLLEKYAAAPFREGPTPRMCWDEVQRANEWLDEHFTFIQSPDDETPTLAFVLDTARQLVARQGISGLVIDPWNELDHQRPDKLTETEYISRCLSQVRQFARKNSVHVWLVAHPTKLQKDKDGGYPVPSPYDISGSAHWRNKADNALAIYREGGWDSNRVQLHVQKIRFKEVGRVGSVQLYYNRVTGRYSVDFQREAN